MRSTGISAKKINELTSSNMGSHYLTDKEQPTVPTEDMFSLLRPHLPEVPEDIERLVFDRTVESKNFAAREVIGQRVTGAAMSKKTSGFDAGTGGTDFGSGQNLVDETAPATSEAKAWEGWGTALKPAHEPVVVGRKPLVGTVAENVLAWGVGGLNIDGSRIGNESRVNPPGGIAPGSGNYVNGKRWEGGSDTVVQGRWPANVIFDEVSAQIIDEQSGENPSRFFYQAKASKRDRNEGLEGLPFGERGLPNQGMQNMDGGRDRLRQNFHPTVKPTALMRYLIKLVTPPGGTVLDPFTGSGSTGKAAILEGFQFVGVELTEDYLPIIEGRLRWAMENADEGTLF
jgi:site-specific DNA-methyltransferase (adenine-specific)